MQKAQQLCYSVASRKPSRLVSLPSSVAKTNRERLQRTTDPSQTNRFRSLSSSRCLAVPRTTPSPGETTFGDSPPVDGRPRPGDGESGENRSKTSRQQTDSSLQEKQVPGWGAPIVGLRRPAQLNEKQVQINELLKQTTRAPQRGLLARSSSVDLLKARSPVKTSTARRQDDVAKKVDGLASLMIDQHLFGHEHKRIDPPAPLRVDAYMGRAQVVDRNELPLGRALGMLGFKLRASDIKGEFFRQKFHERPGLRRKRLKSERWRARFKLGFKHMTQKVVKMRAQGW